ncbi:hypothetical protein V1478_004187 [Vespula squamosa]|uniref:Uncharacterized protein n=1 Tax=Vespula squamosa TaxID=30214 RepID=A0ABD2BK07_VESSQ
MYQSYGPRKQDKIINFISSKKKAAKVLRRLLVGIQRRTDPVTVGSTSVTIKGLFLLLLDEGNDSENEKKK